MDVMDETTPFFHLDWEIFFFFSSSLMTISGSGGGCGAVNIEGGRKEGECRLDGKEEGYEKVLEG